MRRFDRLTALPPLEFALAVECCAPAADRAAKAKQFADNVDWTRFLALCRRHRIQGVVWRAIERFGLVLPEDIASQFAADAVQIATDGLKSASTAARLLGEFTNAGIPILFVKGLSLSKLAYDDPFVKMSHDIDVLVPVEMIDHAAARLICMGYAQALPRHHKLAAWHQVHKESVWTRRGYPTIELHSRLADNRRLIPAIGLLSPVQRVEIAPGVELPTLAPDELIAYLCVHGASSAWFRLKWIADLATLLDRYEPAEIDRVAARAVQLGAGRSVPAALRLARQLFGLTLGPATERAAAIPLNRWLAQIAMRELLDPVEPTRQRLGTIAIHASQLFLMPGAAFMASELLRQVRAALANA